jgi:DNA-binding protein Fis
MLSANLGCVPPATVESLLGPCGNKTKAAKTLGVDRTTLYRKLEEYKVKG